MTESYIKDHPRPQFTRSEWESLNGKWDFMFDDNNEGMAAGWFACFPDNPKEILVPFSYETPKSGIGDESFRPIVWYRRVFTPKTEPGKRVWIYFEGSDYHTQVWVNGKSVGEHRGGYTRFGFDVTPFINDGQNVLTVRVEDSFDCMQPRGKQRWLDNSFGCHYVQTTGIWKTVWMEYTGASYIEKVKMTPLFFEDALDLEWSVSSAVFGKKLKLCAEITFDSKFVNSAEMPVTSRRGKTRLNLWSLNATSHGQQPVKPWTPENPNLYDIKFELTYDGRAEDKTRSYFGMRDIRTRDGMVWLNNAPLYQRLILDQGYWEDSHLTPPDEDSLIEDAEKILAMGYNGVRKHQKVEDERFAYWCDVKGLLLWCEMPSTYEYGDDAVNMFTQEWMAVVEQFYNHPSVVTWTPFNESWGIRQIKYNREQQHFTEAIYHLTKAVDPTRPVIVNDGWEHTVSDILTLHNYEELGEAFEALYTAHKEGILNGTYLINRHKTSLAEGYEYKGQPVIISEYGGAAFSGGATGEWGYGNRVQSDEDFLKRFEDVTSVIKRLPWVCGYCYTQVTDVQQEINGLMDIKREFKVDAKKIKAINLKKV